MLPLKHLLLMDMIGIIEHVVIPFDSTAIMHSALLRALEAFALS